MLNQIDLHTDWNGKEIKFLMNIVFTVSYEINYEDMRSLEYS